MAAISLSTWMLVALLALGLAVLVAVHRRRDVDQNRAGVIDQSHLYLGHRFGYTMGVVLQDRGIEYRLEGSMQARRFGESRVADGSEPERPVLWHGDEARQRPVVRNLFAYVAGRDQSVVLLETDKPR